MTVFLTCMKTGLVCYRTDRQLIERAHHARGQESDAMAIMVFKARRDSYGPYSSTTFGLSVSSSLNLCLTLINALPSKFIPHLFLFSLALFAPYPIPQMRSLGEA